MPRDKQAYKDAAIRLQERRKAKGMSVGELSSRLGVSPARYRTWENIFGPLPQRQYGEAIDRLFASPSACSPPKIGEAISTISLSRIDHSSLGNRAAKRRISIGLSKTFVAAQIGIKEPTLRRWETILPRRHRCVIENAWEDLLQVPRGWLRESSLNTPELPSTAIDLSDSGYVSVADEVLAVGTCLAQSKAKGCIWRSNEQSDMERRQAAMFADRYGVSGPERTTLQMIGNRFSLTRERVRQIIDGMTNRARGVHFTLPRLMELKAAASTPVQWAVAEFEAAHRDLLGSMSLVDADSFAREILGFSVVSITDRAFGNANNPIQPMIVDSGIHGIAIASRAAALKMIRSSGAAHIMFVTGMVSDAIGKAIALSDVRQFLSAIDGMEWLTEDKDWFWFGADGANNRALDVVRKVLATASRRVDIEDLHQALCRSRRTYYKNETRNQPTEIEIPQEVLREVLVRVPWLSVIQKNDFILAECVQIADVLSSSEVAVVGVIVEHGGVVSRRILHKRFVDTGVFSMPTLQIILSNSPVIQPLSYGIYGLRGVEISHTAFLAAIGSTGRHATPFNLTDDGWCEFRFAVSKSGLRNGVADMPTGLVRAIPSGIYTTEGLVNGTFSIGHNKSVPTRATGLAPLLRKAGIQPGEPLLVSIHPKTMRVMILRAEERAASK